MHISNKLVYMYVYYIYEMCWKNTFHLVISHLTSCCYCENDGDEILCQLRYVWHVYLIWYVSASITLETICLAPSLYGRSNQIKIYQNVILHRRKDCCWLTSLQREWLALAASQYQLVVRVDILLLVPLTIRLNSFSIAAGEYWKQYPCPEEAQRQHGPEGLLGKQSASKLKKPHIGKLNSRTAVMSWPINLSCIFPGSHSAVAAQENAEGQVQ